VQVTRGPLFHPSVDVRNVLALHPVCCFPNRLLIWPV
jgi:hypothetical protein